MCNTNNLVHDKLHPVIDIDAIVEEKDELLQRASEDNIILENTYSARIKSDSQQRTVHKPSWNGELTQKTGTDSIDRSDRFKCGR
ncbi:MAG: hypothetical protein HQ568_01575 [Calditrichaeota bacterium]|nr:hypothetical protein [Calditrichota bacterium]